MIGKIAKIGKNFGGCIRYTVQKQDAVILDAQGVRIDQVGHTINDFNMQRGMNPDLGQAVGHVVLSWSVNDKERLNDELMVSIAKTYLEKMKIQNTQALIVKHQDKDHPHLHIVYNRVDNEGKTISDAFQHRNNVNVCKELTIKHGFYIAKNKQHVNRQQLKGEDKLKYWMYDTIKAVSKQVSSVEELKQQLANQGIGLHYKYKSGSNEIQGISFSKGEYKLKGSEIDRTLSFAMLNDAIAKQASGLGKHEFKNQAQELYQGAEKLQPGDLKGDPQIHKNFHIQDVIFGGKQMLDGLSGQSPMEEEQEMFAKRKKKNRWQEQDQDINR